MAPQSDFLWDVCRIPDFRGHQPPGTLPKLISRIFSDLHERGTVSDDWLAREINQIDRTGGDIDALSKRLAFIRTWTYVAQRNGWCADESHWREVTRAVEDRLSDALHDALTQRFVDRRTSVLLRRLKQKEGLVAEVNDKGEVTVEDQFVGRLEAFRFHHDAADDGRRGQRRFARPRLFRRCSRNFIFGLTGFTTRRIPRWTFTEQGGLMWGEHAVGKLDRWRRSAKATERAPSSTKRPAQRLPRRSSEATATLHRPSHS